jgi:DNA-binding response OmpR family regulator
VVAVVCSDEEEPGLIAKLAVAGMPVVALFHQATAAVAAKSLTLGADACLQLDADARLVTAQMHAVLRRHGIFERQPSRDPGVLQIGDLFVDVDRCEVQRAGAVIPLSPSEFRIIEYLARQGGRVSRPHEILNAVSDDYRYMPHEARDVFKVYARRIRRKLEVAEHEPRYLITVRGFGYRLEGGQLCSTSDVTARTAV